MTLSWRHSEAILGSSLIESLKTLKTKPKIKLQKEADVKKGGNFLKMVQNVLFLVLIAVNFWKITNLSLISDDVKDITVIILTKCFIIIVS